MTFTISQNDNNTYELQGKIFAEFRVANLQYFSQITARGVLKLISKAKKEVENFHFIHIEEHKILIETPKLKIYTGFSREDTLLILSSPILLNIDIVFPP